MALTKADFAAQLLNELGILTVPLAVLFFRLPVE